MCVTMNRSLKSILIIRLTGCTAEDGLFHLCARLGLRYSVMLNHVKLQALWTLVLICASKQVAHFTDQEGPMRLSTMRTLKVEGIELHHYTPAFLE